MSTQKCQNCETNNAVEQHTCPYLVGMDRNKETTCNCCKSCTEECREAYTLIMEQE